MSKQVKYEITSEDKTAGGVQSAVNNLRRFDGEAAKITKTFDMIKNSIAVGFAVGAAKAIGDFVGSCVAEFADFEKSNIKLRAALAGNDADINRMGALVEELGSKSNQTNGSIEDLIAELAMLGKSPAEIEKLTRASVILSEVTGQGLDSSFTQLNATFTGTAGKLSKLIPELGLLTSEQLKSGDAVQLVIDNMSVFSDAVAESYSVKLKGLTEAFADLKKELGKGWAEAFKPMTDAATTAVQAITKQFATVKIVRSMEDMSGGIFGGGDEKGLRALRGSMDQETFNAAATQYFNGSAGGLNANPEMIKLIKELARTADIMQRPAGYVMAPVPQSQYGSSTPSTNLTATLPKTEAQKAAEAAEKAWTDFVAANRVGWREISSGIDSIVQEAKRAIAVPLPASEKTTLPIADITKQETKSFDLFGSMDPLPLLEELLSSFQGMIGPILMFKQILDPVSLVLKGFFDTLGPAVTKIIQPLFNAIETVGVVLAESLFPILEAISPIFNILADIIIRSLLPVIQILSPFIEIIAGILDVTLTPILKAVSVAFEILMAPVMFIGDLFSWVALTIKTAIANLVEYIDHPFNENNRNITAYTDFASDAFTGLEQRLIDIWEGNYETTLPPTTTTAIISGTYDPTTGSRGIGASYSAERDIIVNVYAGTVVGDDGIDEFTYMIRDKLSEMNVLGR